MKKLPRKHNSNSDTLHRRPPRFSRELAILYEDDAVVAVNKPAGLLAVPAPGSDAPSALSLLLQDLKPRRQRALVVHRIDRFASGVLLFAKTMRDREALIRQFLAHTPVRQYLAVVRGNLAAKEGTLVHHFRKEGMHQKVSTERDSKAARAELTYSVERSLRAASLLRVQLLTGLQNQIRVQFAALGHPIIGDRKYSSDEASEHRIARVALHAACLEFIHPRSRETVSLECDVPSDFRSLLQALSPPSTRGKR
ncbi:MAG: RNA pseudouridine synthase [Acidobacteria bacterium]|nr:MAG: RNA pseudouridine synthase [Acidobacteriota bacterium]